MRCHTIWEYLKFSNYPQINPIWWWGAELPNMSKTTLYYPNSPTTCAKKGVWQFWVVQKLWLDGGDNYGTACILEKEIKYVILLKFIS